jgi:hypothetical protein
MRIQIALVAVPAPGPTNEIAAVHIETAAAADAGFREQRAYESSTQNRIEQLSSLEQARERRAQAAKLSHEVRERLLMIHQKTWATVISTNRETFAKLRYAAAHSVTGQSQCTICDGKGVLDYCILCQNTGKCPTCKGTGKLEHDDLCPTCLGTGKCYLCFGNGKMTCPFCDDGIVSAKGPPPPQFMPLN